MNLTDHDKAQIEKIKPNTKIRILNEEHRWYIIELVAFINPDQIPIYNHAHFIFFKLRSNGETEWTYTDSSVEFQSSHKYKEIFIDLPSKESKIADLSLSLGVELDQLPSKFYIDCGDRIEVREWLYDMGFRWCDDHSLILDSLDESVIYVDKVMSQCYIRVVDTQDYTLIKPKLTVTSFEIERTQSNENERSKEIDELKRLHNEISERLDALLLK